MPNYKSPLALSVVVPGRRDLSRLGQEALGLMPGGGGGCAVMNLTTNLS